MKKLGIILLIAGLLMIYMGFTTLDIAGTDENSEEDEETTHREINAPMLFLSMGAAIVIILVILNKRVIK